MIQNALLPGGPLGSLVGYRQFVLWERATKIPIAPLTALRCDITDPNAATDAATAIACANLYGPKYGVGFAFRSDDPFVFIDIDKCLLPSGDRWSDTALSVLSHFPGAAVEISQSGTGLHVFGVGMVPFGYSHKSAAHGLEIYTENRYVALTGNGAMGNAGVDINAGLLHLLPTYFPAKTTINTDIVWTDSPVEGWAGPTDDTALISKMMKSKPNVFSGNPSFKEIWNGDPDILGARWPNVMGTGPYDASSVDAALAQHLAFWTGNDCARMWGLMWASELRREKWNREDYLVRTILHAVSLQATWYAMSRTTPTEPLKPRLEPEITAGPQYLAAQQQTEHFKGCVYVRDLHRIYVPDGALLKPDQFKVMYGGYVFALDSGNEKVTKNAFEAFTESQAVRYPRADGICFRPEKPSGELISEEGRTLLNTYIPITTPRQAGDPAPFLNHLSRVLPNAHDQAVLLAYMAACVQYPGVKFQWAPLLQGCEGNGKTLFISCLANAVGHRYTHLPNASDLGGNGSKFNAWIQNKLFIGVEEIFVSDRREVSEALKPLITNSRIEIQGKGIDQVTGDNRANFLLCSNHKNAIAKTRSDRRYCILYTAQQSAEDMVKEGWLDAYGNATAYFNELYTWLRGGGYEIVTDYLHTYAIPDALNPATSCHRAPTTTSTLEAVEVSLGRVEQEVMEAIEADKAGFRGGWVSSMAVENLLAEMNLSRLVPRNRRRDLLISLGYDYHPALKKGRVDNVVLPDGGKPRLFIRQGHIHAGLTTGAEVSRHYSTAQGGAPTAVPGSIENKA